MPRSFPWAAPEWHHRGFSFEEATKMDMFSFGMLCFWLLFSNTNERQTRDFMEQCNLHETASIRALETVIASKDTSSWKKRDLSRLFDLTLVTSPAQRSSHFLEILPLLAPERY
jgi:hypothetical protein